MLKNKLFTQIWENKKIGRPYCIRKIASREIDEE
jgi:hypothetical protein